MRAGSTTFPSGSTPTGNLPVQVLRWMLVFRAALALPAAFAHAGLSGAVAVAAVVYVVLEAT